MFFVEISFLPEPLHIETPHLTAKLRSVVLEAILEANRGSVEALEVSITTRTLEPKHSILRVPVYVKIFTSDPRWVALDNTRRMGRFMQYATEKMPELRGGRLYVLIIPMETFVSP